METGHQDVRQYGGYGGYGGFVECCEGVVDPLLLGIIAALAGLTFFLQQQVVMSIAGRRSLRTSDDDSFETYFNQISNFLDVNDIFETEDNQESNHCPSYSDTGSCLAKAMVQS